MSEEESFVILGSSPLPSLCADGNSLLQDAVHDGVQADEIDNVKNEPPGFSRGNIEDPPSSLDRNKEESTSLTQLSVSISQARNNNSILATSAESNAPGEAKSLAASFILGEVNSVVLKNSVYSQFPSLCSMEASAEDVVKLQNMITEYAALKQTLNNVNHTMENYYKITQQWRKEAGDQEKLYKKEVNALQEQVAKLREENEQLKNLVEANKAEVHTLEEIWKKEQEELKKDTSEKTSLIMNMRAEIDKLQQQQLHSFDFVPEHKIEAENGKAAKEIKEFPEMKIKQLEYEMTKLMAENLETMDMKKIYIDEINCLKVNLTSAEELIGKMQKDIDKLKANDVEKEEKIADLLTQIENYRKDFEMERADRVRNAAEKEQYLLDLRDLQRRNQKLIEDMAATQKNIKSPNSPASSLTTSSSSLRDNQRPVRVLDPTGAAAQTSAYALRCPICAKSFNSVSVLQSHVNDCLDNC